MTQQPGDHPQQPQQPYGDQPTTPYGQTPAGGSYGQPPAGGSYGGDGTYAGSGGGPGGGGPLGAAPGGKGFLGALFDLSFSTFVTPMIIRTVYVIGLVLIGIATLFFSLSGFFGDSPALGIVTLIIGPIVGLLYLCFFRMMCEFYIAIVRMSEDINRRLPRV